ncbi:hypothetical protein Mapa_000866 [Marchantia paleacea]|nr:hypothetical protein Mapa_000866 [Marchantia paleacea]
MAPKISATDLWKGFTKDKIITFQRELMKPCQMSRTTGSQLEETGVGPDFRDRFTMHCIQYYQIVCSWARSWFSILLAYFLRAKSVVWMPTSKAMHRRGEVMDRVREVVSPLRSLATKAYHGRGEVMNRVKQMYRLVWSLASSAIQWRTEMVERVKRNILSRVSSFYCPEGDNNLEKQRFRRRFPVDRVYEQISYQCGKIQKRIVKIVTYKVALFVGLLAAQALLVYFVHKSRSSSHVRECQRARQLPHHHMPSVWYYEHIHYYPVPQLKILTAEDGAPPIQSQLAISPREITIATHTTMDRFPAVEMTAFRWSGPMVLVVLVRVQSELESTYAKLEFLHSRVEAEGRCRLHIHIAFEEGFRNDVQALQALYPINSMRNLALGMVTTQLVFLVDADFVPNPGLHEHLTQHEEKFNDLIKKTEDWNQLLVVPAFQLSEDKSIEYQHSLHGYEPFYIASMNHLPKFDARFRGHGKNKISHTYLLSVKDFTFWVIPEGFLVELPHPPSLSEKRKVQDPLQTWRIDGIYNRYIREINWIYNITTASKKSEMEKMEGLLC